MSNKTPLLPPYILEAGKIVMELLRTHNIEFKIIGGIAVSHYSQPRMTEDIDFLIRSEDASTVKSLFRKTEPIFMENTEGFTTKINDVDVDFILSDDEIFSSPNEMYHDMPVPSKELTLLLKLRAGRTKDFADLVAMLKHSSPENVKHLLKFVKKQYPDYIEDLQTAAEIAKLEAAGTKKDKVAARKMLLTVIGKR